MELTGRRLSPTGVPLDRQGPRYKTTRGELDWVPEARIAYLTKDGSGGTVFSSESLEDPSTRPMMVAEIGLHAFNCWATYYAGGDWRTWETLMLGQIAESVFLVSDEPGQIYCIASWKGLMVLFARLDPLCEIWDRCNAAFKSLNK